MVKLLIALSNIIIATALLCGCSFNIASEKEQGLSIPSVNQSNKAAVNIVDLNVTDLSLATRGRVLLFTKTAGYRHKSIAVGKKAIETLAKSSGFTVVSSQSSELFSDEQLQHFDVVIFLNTTGNILTSEQQTAFERYIQAGGGFVGIHAAADTEHNWPWYGRLVGAYFLSHPKQQTATMAVVQPNHPSTKHLKTHLNNQWRRYDEWYNFHSFNPQFNVLLSIDESSYSGGKNGQYHPIAWYHEFDGGRAFYTGMGHTKQSYADPDFLQHLLGGILYSADVKLADKQDLRE